MGGLIDALGLPRPRAPVTAVTQGAAAPAKAVANPSPTTTASEGAAAGATGAALPAKQSYLDERAALEAGELAALPAQAPRGIEGAHKAVMAARAALPADPKDDKQLAAARKSLALLRQRIADYRQAEAKTIASLRKKHDDIWATFDKDRERIPDQAPQGLEKVHAAVVASQEKLPADLDSIDHCLAAIAALPAIRKAVAAYLKAEKKKAIVDEGLSKFGSKGAQIAELKGSDKLNGEQKRMLDQKLSEKLGGGAMSDGALKKYAQTVVEKTNKLAETPLEKKIPGINAKLAKSDALKTNIVKLQAQKWKIKVNKPGGGSFCDKVNKVIAIDPSDPLEESLGGLAHETGHALYTPPKPPTIKESADGWTYVRKGTESNFLDEGEAQMVACRTAKEMSAAGEKSNVPADGGQFIAIYEKHTKGELTEEAARKEMAKQFGSLVTSTTGESYLVYYGRFHLQTWNHAHKKDAAKQLDAAGLPALVLFP